MQAQTAEAPSTSRRKPVGRLDADKQEKVIELAPIRDRVDELVALLNKANETSADFAEAIKKAAEDSGLLSSVVRRFITAKAGEKFLDKKRECEQLSILFEDVGG